ncbi:MAG: cytochrome c3 family protein, partial [Kiritimatiellota bacterium]|nr:cytochrome c3 family protein [Kiritimatiellota bacterium]
NGTETKQTETIAVEEGVSCESCHGPGKNYKSKETMKSREKSAAGGMIYPATKSCERCHNEKSPTWNPEKYTTKDGKKVGFDAEQACKKIEHLNPNVVK